MNESRREGGGGSKVRIILLTVFQEDIPSNAFGSTKGLKIVKRKTNGGREKRGGSKGLCRNFSRGGEKKARLCGNLARTERLKR